MLRDNLVGLIEPMLSGAGAYPLALRTNRKPSSDDRPACLENPRPAGAESTLTENVASPFHAEPGQYPQWWTHPADASADLAAVQVSIPDEVNIVPIAAESLGIPER